MGGGGVGGGTVGGGTVGGGTVGGGTAVDCRTSGGCGANASCDFQTGRCVCDANYRQCGSVCAACPTAGVTATTCSGNSCVATTCAAGSRVCNGVCTTCPSGATATSCDAQNRCIATACAAGSRACAGTCASCPSGAATTSCGGANQASCVPLTCSSGTNSCGGLCVPDTDATQCGPSCQVCPAETTPTGTWAPVCRASVCGQGCPAGEALCKGVCAAGSCVWSTTSVTASSTKFSVASRENIVSAEAYLAFLKPDPRTVGSPVRTFINAFTRTSAIQEPTGTGWQSATDGSGSAPLAVSMSTGVFSYGLPISSTRYDVYSCNTSYCSVRSLTNGSGIDSTETGIAAISQNVSSALPWRLSHDLEDCCGFSTAPSAVWNVSTPTTKRLAWLSSTGALQLATRGTSSWSTSTLSSAPPSVTLLRAKPNGDLVNVERTATGLEVRVQSAGWNPIQLSLPSGAVWKAKFDFNGVFRVVSSDSSTGTMLHTLQGSTFASELVATQSFGAVDFTVLRDDAAVVVGGAGSGLVVFR